MSSEAVSLGRVDGRKANPTEEVDAVCYRFEVSGVDARPVTAEMVKRLPRRDWSHQIPIRKAVGALTPAVVPAQAIPVGVLLARPDPALVGPVFAGCQEAENQIIVGGPHRPNIRSLLVGRHI
jgi:hypothetical protein